MTLLAGLFEMRGCWHIGLRWAILALWATCLSFFFLSNFQTLKFFVTFFSRTVRPRQLKLGTHLDIGQMYGVYRNQAAAAYLSLYFSFFFLQFSTLKFFITLFSGTVRSRRMKLVTHMENGWMYHVYRNHAAVLICPFIFLSLQFSNIKNFRHTFLRYCES